MARSRTYHASVLVLRKRKLGESDLILSLLAGDGSLIEAVAKGGRKPTSTFATRLDLFCESEVMLARGKNLDIASEARLINAHDALRSKVTATYAAAPILDCIAHVAMPNMPEEHLFAMASSALTHMDKTREELLPSFTAAFLVKLLAVIGVNPTTDRCIGCEAPVTAETTPRAYFSFTDGGYVCDSCAARFERTLIDRDVLVLATTLLRSTFDEVESYAFDPQRSFAVLHFIHQWLRETQNINSKALAQLLSCGLF